MAMLLLGLRKGAAKAVLLQEVSEMMALLKLTLKPAEIRGF
jgi:hypothetical protein